MVWKEEVKRKIDNGKEIERLKFSSLFFFPGPSLFIYFPFRSFSAFPSHAVGGYSTSGLHHELHVDERDQVPPRTMHKCGRGWAGRTARYYIEMVATARITCDATIWPKYEQQLSFIDTAHVSLHATHWTDAIALPYILLREHESL